MCELARSVDGFCGWCVCMRPVYVQCIVVCVCGQYSCVCMVCVWCVYVVYVYVVCVYVTCVCDNVYVLCICVGVCMW